MGKPGKERVAAASMACLCLAISAGVAAGQKPQPPVRRASPPPPTEWDKATAGTFYDDAFSVLSGPRPDFANAAKRPVTGPAAAGQPAADATGPSSGGFKWSSLVSEDTLVDEIKTQLELLGPAVASPTTFKGGGYDQARRSFSMLAVAFGVIAAHDQDVRWKKDATTARDLFARAGFNCKTATDQGFNESKLRIEDLQSMMNGSPPAGKPDRDEDFAWSQAAARPALMGRLEDAEKAISAGLSSSAEFTKNQATVFHEAEVVAALGEVIGLPDFEYHDDESYLELAHSMRDSAVRVRDAAMKKDYDAARAAAGGISKACSSCHESYR
jgi:hypothetical protein